MIKKIKDTENLINTTEKLIPTNWPESIKNAAIATIALRLAIYPLGELVGKKIRKWSQHVSFLQIPRIVRIFSKKLGDYTVRTLVEIPQVIEVGIYGNCYNRLTRDNAANPRIENLLRRCMVSPPISMIIVGPIVEECIFRLPLIYTSGYTNLILTSSLSFVFALSHEESVDVEFSSLQPNRIAALTAMGMTYALMANKYNFLAAMLTHIGYNLSCWVHDR